MKYRSEIDGLRALAVLPVILFHAGFERFSGGYVGVDIFFVISGYLITTILISEFDQAKFSILKFYERRARRILPALFFVMICCIPFALFWMQTSELIGFGKAFVAIGVFASNILFWRNENYFAPAAEDNPLLHTWSLAVEEQFYLFFPVLLIITWRFGRQPVFYLVVFFCVISLLMAEWGWRNYPSANFYLLPTRAWELGVGAICAFLMFGRSYRNHSFLAFLGLMMIVFSIFVYNKQTPFPSVYALVPVVGTALVILYAHPLNIVGRLLSLPIFVGLGLISYSAYLWHQPLFAFARIRSPFPPDALMMLGLSALSLILAYASWRFVEQPFRRRDFFLSNSRHRIFTSAGLTSLAVIAFGFFLYAFHGLPNRNTPNGESYSNITPELTEPNYGLSSKCDGSFNLTDSCRTSDKPSVLIWGDSYVMHLKQALSESKSYENHTLQQFTKSSCTPLIGIARTNSRLTKESSRACLAFNEKAIKWLAENNSVEYVIMSTPLDMIGEYYYDTEGHRHPPSAEAVMDAIKITNDFIVANGKKPVWVSPPPRTGNDLSKCALNKRIFGNDYSCEFYLLDQSEKHRAVIEFLRRPDFPMPVLFIEDFLCSNGICPTLAGKVNIYRDTGHLSIVGSEWIGKEYDLFGRILSEIESQNQGLLLDKPSLGEGL